MTESQEDRLAEIVRQSYQSLRALAAGAVRGDPDDVVQEALVRVLKRGSIETIADIPAYLRRTVVNVAIDQKRRERAAQRAADRSGPPEARVEATYPSDVTDLMALDVRSRALLFLTEIEGATVAEAADAVGCSQPAARMRLTRARRQLRHLFEEEEEDDDAPTRRI